MAKNVAAMKETESDGVIFNKLLESRQTDEAGAHTISKSADAKLWP
jgi:hypothetical protein